MKIQGAIGLALLIALAWAGCSRDSSPAKKQVAQETQQSRLEWHRKNLVDAKKARYALAREQFAYCDDIVTQGVGSIDALADGLRGSKSWYFWWD